MPSRIDTPVTGSSPNPVGSLTASARSLDENADWQSFGVSHVPEACDEGWVWQQCSVVEDEFVKPLNEGVDAVTFLPFLVEANAASCDGLPDWSVLEARARRTLQWNASKQIGKAFSAVAPDGNPNLNPSLPNTATDITPGGGPSSLVNTLCGLLQDAIACGLSGDVFIHAPHWTLPHFLNDTLIQQVGSTYKLGQHTVVLDQGYTNEPPTGGADAADGQAWVYITGPVEYATGSVLVLQDETRGVDILLNKANVIAAELAIYRFDPCCVYGALAQVC